MATIDLGKIAFTQKGTWASGTAYVAKDVVQYTDGNDTSSYVAIASSTGQAPSTNGTLNSSNWALFAKGASIGSTYLATYAAGTTYKKGDIVQYTDSGVISTFLYINTTPASGQTPSTGGTVNSTYWALVAKGTASVAISWQSTAKTANFTAAASEGYFVDTNGGTFTCTTPSSPSAGDEFILTDLRGTFGTNALSVAPNGSDKIKGTTDTVELAENYGSTRLVYSGATYGWIPVSSAAVISAPLVKTYNVQYLCVAGGGGGGGDNGGGGGAGGYRTVASKNFSVVAGTQYTITVGAGGSGDNSSNTQQTNGSNSVFSTITSAGGGYASSQGGSGGADGGSGGGAGQAGGSGGSGNVPSTNPSQGNNGGSPSGNPSVGSGGGGSSGVGSNSSQNSGGAGGAGTSNSISGSSVSYAGGGSGGADQNNNGGGQSTSGGGGTGGTGGSNGNNGTANTGGGGGGGGQDGNATGGSGGSGIVIIRRLTADSSTASGGTESTSGSDTIHKFTSSGTFNA